MSSCDRSEDAPDREEIAAQVRAEVERGRAIEKERREKERAANRERMMKELASEEATIAAGSLESAPQEEESAPEREFLDEPELSVTESREDPAPAPVLEDPAIAAREAMEEAIAEAEAFRKEGMDALGKAHETLAKIQEISRRENAIDGNMKRKGQAEAALRKQEEAVAAIEAKVDAANAEVKRLRDLRLTQPY